MMFHIGSVSHGTLRAEDLGPEFLYVALRMLRGKKREKWQSEVIRDARAEDRRGWTGEHASEVIEELESLLSQLAPPYVYFGAHEGDPANFGFWPDWRAIENDTRDGEILAIEAGDEVPKDYRGYVIATTDHGNVTFYVKTDRGMRELWSCV
jgi:hypothetical protein